MSCCGRDRKRKKNVYVKVLKKENFSPYCLNKESFITENYVASPEQLLGMLSMAK